MPTRVRAAVAVGRIPHGPPRVDEAWPPLLAAAAQGRERARLRRRQPPARGRDGRAAGATSCRRATIAGGGASRGRKGDASPAVGGGGVRQQRGRRCEPLCSVGGRWCGELARPRRRRDHNRSSRQYCCRRADADHRSPLGVAALAVGHVGPAAHTLRRQRRRGSLPAAPQRPPLRCGGGHAPNGRRPARGGGEHAQHRHAEERRRPPPAGRPSPPPIGAPSPHRHAAGRPAAARVAPPAATAGISATSRGSSAGVPAVVEVAPRGVWATPRRGGGGIKGGSIHTRPRAPCRQTHRRRRGAGVGYTPPHACRPGPCALAARRAAAVAGRCLRVGRRRCWSGPPPGYGVAVGPPARCCAPPPVVCTEPTHSFHAKAVDDRVSAR